MVEICPDCKGKFKNLGSHKRFCKAKQLTVRQEIPKTTDIVNERGNITIPVMDRSLEEVVNQLLPPGEMPDKLIKDEVTNEETHKEETIKESSEEKSTVNTIGEILPLTVEEKPFDESNLSEYKELCDEEEVLIVTPSEPIKTEYTLDEIVEQSKLLPSPEILQSEIKETSVTPKADLSVKTISIIKASKKSMPKWFAWLLLVVILLLIIYLLIKVI